MTAPSILLWIRSFMSLLGRLRNVALLFRIIGGACRYFAGKDGQLHTSAPPKYCATVMARFLLGVEAWQLSVRPRLLDELFACGGLVPTGACYLLYLGRRCSVQLAFPGLFSRSLMRSCRWGILHENAASTTIDSFECCSRTSPKRDS